MALTPAEKQRRYRERLKAKAAAGDEKAKAVIKRKNSRAPYNNAKNFIRNRATPEQLKEFQEIIKNKLTK